MCTYNYIALVSKQSVFECVKQFSSGSKAFSSNELKCPGQQERYWVSPGLKAFAMQWDMWRKLWSRGRASSVQHSQTPSPSPSYRIPIGVIFSFVLKCFDSSEGRSREKSPGGCQVYVCVTIVNGGGEG